MVYQDTDSLAAEVECNGTPELGRGACQEDLDDVIRELVEDYSGSERVAMNDSNSQLRVLIDEQSPSPV